MEKTKIGVVWFKNRGWVKILSVEYLMTPINEFLLEDIE